MAKPCSRIILYWSISTRMTFTKRWLFKSNWHESWCLLYIQSMYSGHDRILAPCNHCHHPWCVGDKSYHKALLIMFSCDGISNHASWNEVFSYWDTKLSWIKKVNDPGGANKFFSVIVRQFFMPMLYWIYPSQGENTFWTFRAVNFLFFFFWPLYSKSRIFNTVPSISHISFLHSKLKSLAFCTSMSISSHCLAWNDSGH